MWDPYHNNHIASIEKIQRRALRWTLNDYNFSHSVTTMLQSLNWPTLQHRHKRMCLTLLYKSINGHLALKIPNYFTAISTNTRIHHHQTYHFTCIRTDAYMNSFFPRTIREWNYLPQHVIDSNSLDLFQEQIDIYLNTVFIVIVDFFVIVWDKPWSNGHNQLVLSAQYNNNNNNKNIQTDDTVS